VGRRTGMPRTQKVEGRQIRGGVRPGRVRNTGQSPLSVNRVKPRISDDRALKVAGAYPGRPAASRWGCCLGYRNRDNRLTKSPASVGHRILTTDEPNLEKERNTKKRMRRQTDQRVSKPQGALIVYAGVSRGHSRRWKSRQAGTSGIGNEPKFWRTHPAKGPNGAACRMAGVNGSGK